MISKHILLIIYIAFNLLGIFTPSYAATIYYNTSNSATSAIYSAGIDGTVNLKILDNTNSPGRSLVVDEEQAVMYFVLDGNREGIWKSNLNGSGRELILSSVGSAITDIELDKVSQKNIKQIKGLVQSITSKILAKKPVYRLKDDNLKHKLAKDMLQSIAVVDKTLRIKLSVL